MEEVSVEDLVWSRLQIREISKEVLKKAVRVSGEPADEDVQSDVWEVFENQMRLAKPLPLQDQNKGFDQKKPNWSDFLWRLDWLDFFLDFRSFLDLWLLFQRGNGLLGFGLWSIGLLVDFKDQKV